MIRGAILTGTITLKDGSVRELSTPDMVRLCQWLAGLSARKKKKVLAPPDDFLLNKE